MTQEGARADVAHAALAADAARLRHDLDELQAEFGTAMMALHDASGLADKRWSETVDLRLDNQRLADQVDRDRASVAALETRVLGATTRADDLARDLALARERAAAAAPVAPDPPATSGSPDPSVAAAAEAAARALDQAHRREIEHLTHEVQFAHQQATSAERRAAEATREVDRVSAERDALAAELAGLRTKPEPAATDDLGRLRIALAALADDVVKATDKAGTTPGTGQAAGGAV